MELRSNRSRPSFTPPSPSSSGRAPPRRSEPSSAPSASAQEPQELHLCARAPTGLGPSAAPAPRRAPSAPPRAVLVASKRHGLTARDAVQLEPLGPPNFAGCSHPASEANIHSLEWLRSQAREPNVGWNRSVPLGSPTKHTLRRHLRRGEPPPPCRLGDALRTP